MTPSPLTRTHAEAQSGQTPASSLFRGPVVRSVAQASCVLSSVSAPDSQRVSAQTAGGRLATGYSATGQGTCVPQRQAPDTCPPR